MCLGEWSWLWSGLWNPAPDIAAEIFVQQNVHTTTTNTIMKTWFFKESAALISKYRHQHRPKKNPYLKLTQLSVPSSIWQWITSFLTDRQQLVRLGKFMSNSSSTNTGAPQGCVLSSLLFSLYTNDCTSKDPSVKLLKFADDTILTGLIQDGDESAYRRLKSWLFGAV